MPCRGGSELFVVKHVSDPELFSDVFVAVVHVYLEGKYVRVVLTTPN